MTYEHARIVNVDLDGAARGIRAVNNMSNVDRLVQTLICCPGITEITLAEVFTVTDFFDGARFRVQADTMSWSYKINDVLLQAERYGVIRYNKCLDPRFRSYFAVKTQVTV